MFNMFDNYPQPEGYIPHNRREICREPLTIMAGETTQHSFEVPANLEEFDINEIECRAIYKLGLNVVLVKNLEKLEDNKDCVSILYCDLSSTDTKIFEGTYFNAEVQLKFILPNNNIMYSEVMPIVLQDSLDRGFE